MRAMTATELSASDDHRVEELIALHMVEPTRVPRGPKGLWSALAVTAAPGLNDRALPRIDASGFCVQAAPSMFDYDASTAIRLDDVA